MYNENYVKPLKRQIRITRMVECKLSYYSLFNLRVYTFFFHEDLAKDLLQIFY